MSVRLKMLPHKGFSGILLEKKNFATLAVLIYRYKYKV